MDISRKCLCHLLVGFVLLVVIQSKPAGSVEELPDFEIDKLADHASRERNQENNPVIKEVPQKRLDTRDADDTPTDSDVKISTGSDVAADSAGGAPDQEPIAEDSSDTWQTIVLIAVVAGCSVAGIVGLVVAGVCWYKLQKNVKAASEADYPAYGVTGPTTERAGSPGDRKLAHSAQMYHYQHQKQQMIAMERANGDMNKDEEEESDVENEEGDYTVYECPGLAPTGEMEVKNPLFNEDTPVTPSGGEVKPDSK